jgi:hypothetical protein
MAERGGDRVKHGLGQALQTAAGKGVADETRTVTEAVAALPRGPVPDRSLLCDAR